MTATVGGVIAGHHPRHFDTLNATATHPRLISPQLSLCPGHTPKPITQTRRVDTCTAARRSEEDCREWKRSAGLPQSYPDTFEGCATQTSMSLRRRGELTIASSSAQPTSAQPCQQAMKGLAPAPPGCLRGGSSPQPQQPDNALPPAVPRWSTKRHDAQGRPDPPPEAVPNHQRPADRLGVVSHHHSFARLYHRGTWYDAPSSS